MWWICDGAPKATSLKRGLYLAPFDESADPRLLAQLPGDRRIGDG